MADNGENNQDLNIPLTVIVEDSSGDQGTGIVTLNVDVQDDVPEISAEQDTPHELTITNYGSPSADAYFHNSFGYYIKDADGNPVDGVVIWDDVQDADATTETISGYTPDQIGFFIIPNGENNNPGLTDGAEVTFSQLGDGTWAAFLDGVQLVGADPDAPVLFDNTDLNPDTYEYATDNALIGNLNWEDTFGSGDGDNNDLNINIEWTEVANTLTVDETDLADSTSTVVNLDVSGSFTFSPGADGLDSIEYSLELPTATIAQPNPDSGLNDSLTGESVLLRVNGNVIEGYTSAGVVFTVAVDANGIATLTQYRPVEHNDPNDADEAGSPAMIADGLISLSATITDNDGDTATASIDVGQLIAFEDDGPVAVDDDVVTSENTAININVLGNDSLGVEGAGITEFTQPSLGSVVLNGDGTFTYTPATNVPGSDTFTYTLTDADGDTSTATVTIQIDPEADAPILLISVDSSTPGIPESMGLTKAVYTNFEGGLLASDTLESLTDSAVADTITIETQAYRDGGNGPNNIAADSAEVTTGLIYLDAGAVVSFSGYADDSLRIELGGQTLVSTTGDSWGNYDTSIVGTSINGRGPITTAGDFIAVEAGYYTLEVYIYNHSGPGDMSINITIDGVTTPLNTVEVQIYPDIDAVDTAEGSHSAFVAGSESGTDGGHYPLTYSYTMNIMAVLTDVDGSETLGLVTIPVASLPADVEIDGLTPNGDGNYEIDASTSVEVTLISGSPLTDVEINAISGSVTATETSNGDTATTDVTARVEFEGLDASGETADLVIEGNSRSNNIIGGEGDDIIFGGGRNDSLTGGDGADEFVWTKSDLPIGGRVARDSVEDFDGTEGDVLNLADLLSDGSHTIEGLVANDDIGSGQHLQLSIMEGGRAVQTIDLNNVAVNLGDDPTEMLNNLLANGEINDGM